MEAVTEMKTVKYQQHKVMFFPDFSMEVRRQRKQFDGVKKPLQLLNIEYRLTYPAKTDHQAQRTEEDLQPSRGSKEIY